MALWHDEKYLRLLSPQLELFKQKQPHTYNFRCPLCGDSEKTRTKARGYVFPAGQKLMFKCHNCSVAIPFSSLLKKMNGGLWNDYLLESLDTAARPSKPVEEPTQPPVPTRIPQAAALSPLSAYAEPTSPLHAVYAYAKNRLLPDVAFTRLFATDRAHSWILPLVGPEKAEKVGDGEPYLVQPLRLTDGTWYGAQLRHLNRKDYLTFRWSHDPLKTFGLEAWDWTKLTIFVEGPLDACFIPNAIATCGSDLLGTARILEEQDIMTPSLPRLFVWDNEPRNKEVTRHIRTAIRLGEAVVIWPKHYPKDINDMVKAGISVADIMKTIDQRTYTGLMAELEFEQWKS